jgi:outer membrane protein TolC
MGGPGRPRARGIVGRLVLCGTLLCAAATARAEPQPPEAASAPWLPAAGDKPAPLEVPHTEIPAVAPGSQVTLAQVLDLALRNSPHTRETWLAARAAAAEIGVQRAQYYPSLGVGANATRVEQSQVGGTVRVQQTVYGPTADLAMLLFDFGGRRADIEEARQALLAADWTHNAAIQDVVLSVERAYYGYLGSASLRDAYLESVRQAQASLDASEARRQAGLATISDVLLARTLLAQQRFALARTEGEMSTTKGALATAVGLPPDIQVEVSRLGALPDELPAVPELAPSTEAMGRLLRRALADRPELLAERAAVLAAQERVKQERSEGLPTLTLGATANRTFYVDRPNAHPSTNTQAQLLLRWPLFTGFETRFRVAKAKAEAELEQAHLDEVVQVAMLDVWTAFYKLQTAAQSVDAGRALLDSAAQSADVAGGRYKEGVGNILDLLTAQSALASARATEILSRAEWFVALAELQRSTGALGLAAPVEEPAEGPAAEDAPNSAAASAEGKP